MARWSVWLTVTAALGLLAAAGNARADLGPPSPTFVMDSLYLDWPIGPIIGVTLSAAAISLFFVLRRRGLPRWWAAGLCLGAYLIVNLGVYHLAFRSLEERKRQKRQQHERWLQEKPAEDTKPSAPVHSQPPRSGAAGTTSGE